MVKFNNKGRLIALMAVTSVFFLAEIITGYATNSMALVADSFHMLSDILSILIGYISVHYSDKKSRRNTYDWARAEVLGAMANAVFLLALVFTIVINAIQRLVEVEEITKPLVILGVGAAGLAINIFGLCLFGGHAHGHSHGHHNSHGHHHHSHESQRLDVSNYDSCEVNLPANPQDSAGLKQPIDKPSSGERSQLNMHAVFLHVLGDALGSIVVIVSALIIYFVKDHWRFYIDPLMSLVVCVIITWTTIPVLCNASMILLQSPPENIDMDKLRKDISQVSGVINIHDLHVWQLSGERVIGTVHLVLRDDCNFTGIARQIKAIFHEFSIHATTIQPEFHKQLSSVASCDIDMIENSCSCQPDVVKDDWSSCHRSANSEEEADRTCLLRCASKDCSTKMCCDDVRQDSKTKQYDSFNNPGYGFPATVSKNNDELVISAVDGLNGKSSVA